MRKLQEKRRLFIKYLVNKHYILYKNLADDLGLSLIHISEPTRR